MGSQAVNIPKQTNPGQLDRGWDTPSGKNMTEVGGLFSPRVGVPTKMKEQTSFI